MCWNMCRPQALKARPQTIAARKETRQYPPPLCEKGGPIGKAAVGITEGGGTALFRVGKGLKGSKINQMTAKAMKTIWEDEKDHYMVQADIAAKMIKNKADMKKMQEAMIDVSLQRVWMRNEMFRSPMTTAEVEAYIVRRQSSIAKRS